MKKFGLLAMAAVGVFSLAACNNASEDTTNKAYLTGHCVIMDLNCFVNVYLKEDNKAFFDMQVDAPKAELGGMVMNEAFDVTFDYAYDKETGVYTFTHTYQKEDNGSMVDVPREYKTVVNGNSGLDVIPNYKVWSEYGEVDCILWGKLPR